MQILSAQETSYWQSALILYGGSNTASTVPDAPINVANNAASTSATQIGLTWSPGRTNGGSEIIDYTILKLNATGSFVYLVSGVTSTLYTATGLKNVQTYQFKV